MHPELTTISIHANDETTEEEWDQINAVLSQVQDEAVVYIKSEAERLGIDERYMSDIFYLRSRSRWTQEKEDYLISLAREGKPFPDILSGEF